MSKIIKRISNIYSFDYIVYLNEYNDHCYYYRNIANCDAIDICVNLEYINTIRKEEIKYYEKYINDSR
jgi:hypothetical protein